MIVLLDATELMRDPLCEGVAWRVLAHAAPAWKLRIIVSEVVMAEAVAGYQRRVNEARVGYERWIERHGAPLGLSDIADAAMAAMTGASESYGDRLRERLRAAGVEFIEPPDVPHMRLVVRATTRRAPCNANGDGYRDTLNWLTVVGFASSDPDEEIAWVTGNSRDFANVEETGLNEALLNELAEAGAQDRVRWIRTIPELVLAVAAELAPEAGTDLDTVSERLRDDAVLAYLAGQVPAAASGTQVDPRICALPISTKSVRILEVGAPRNLRLNVRGSVPGDETVAEFTIEADTTLSVELADSGEMQGDQWTLLSLDAGGATARLVKPLLFRGLITLARYERPLGAELSRVTAVADDPGLAVWAALPRLADWLSTFRGPLIPPDVLKSLQVPIMPPDLFKNLRLPIIQPDLFKNLQLPIIPPGLFKSLQMPVIPPGVWRYLTERAEEPAPAQESEEAEAVDDDELGQEGDQAPPEEPSRGESADDEPEPEPEGGQSLPQEPTDGDADPD